MQTLLAFLPFLSPSSPWAVAELGLWEAHIESPCGLRSLSVFAQPLPGHPTCRHCPLVLFCTRADAAQRQGSGATSGTRGEVSAPAQRPTRFWSPESRPGRPQVPVLASSTVRPSSAQRTGQGQPSPARRQGGGLLWPQEAGSLTSAWQRVGVGKRLTPDCARCPRREGGGRPSPSASLLGPRHPL